MQKKNRPSVPVSIRIPADLNDAIDKRAAEIGGTRALIVHQALRAFFGMKHLEGPMPQSPTPSIETFDDIRAAHPDLAVNCYGMTPGGAVTLELIVPDGRSYTFTGPTARAAIELAFPAPDVSEKPTDDEPQTDVFS